LSWPVARRAPHAFHHVIVADVLGDGIALAVFEHVVPRHEVRLHAVDREDHQRVDQTFSVVDLRTTQDHPALAGACIREQSVVFTPL
jgi:hypothetical protein